MAGSPFPKIDRLYDEEMRARAREAEKDKPLITCGILEFFEQVTGFKPTSYQERLLLDPSHFVVARWARQSGKSLTLSVICAYTALSAPNQRIAILAPSLRQGKLMILRVESFLPRLPENVLEGRALKTKQKFTNGSTIEAFPNSPETVRGLTNLLLVIDDINYIDIDTDLYDAVIYSLGTTNGRLIVTSTPGTRDSLFYEMNMNNEEYGDFSRHHVSFHDALEPNGPLKKAMLEKLERQMQEDPSRWQREMLAEFSVDEEAWFSWGLIEGCVDENLEYTPDFNKEARDS